MSHLLYLMFRCDFDVMENLKNLEEFGDAEEAETSEVDAAACLRKSCAPWTDRRGRGRFGMSSLDCLSH